MRLSTFLLAEQASNLMTVKRMKVMSAGLSDKRGSDQGFGLDIADLKRLIALVDVQSQVPIMPAPFARAVARWRQTRQPAQTTLESYRETIL